MRNVFISFDVDDVAMVNLLRIQAKRDRFQFVFRDYSVKEPFEYRWKREVKNLIYWSSAVIVAIGKNTYKSKAVNWEISEAHRQGKQVIGIRLHRYENHMIPYAMNNDVITYWNTYDIANILGE
ncbi:MAG: TIR domain-containing protein [Thaumarchaeota archaeon]|nr:TIR domain-containing protein [Nitrososphaerota archaeon]